MKPIALITGASSGFGQACAVKLAQNGFALVLTARRHNRLLALQQQLNEQTDCHIEILDVRDAESVKQLPRTLPPAFQKVDILINNAGLALGLEPAQAADLSDWDTMIDTNTRALVHISRAFLPGMVQRNSGHIINMASIAGTWPYPGGNVYGASKAFVQQFSRNLRADLLGTAIRVTNIDPGLAETEFSNIRFKGDDDKADQVYEGLKPLQAEDIAEAVFWAISQPKHVNINTIELMPSSQAWGPLAINRS